MQCKWGRNCALWNSSVSCGKPYTLQDQQQQQAPFILTQSWSNLKNSLSDRRNRNILLLLLKEIDRVYAVRELLELQFPSLVFLSRVLCCVLQSKHLYIFGQTLVCGLVYVHVYTHIIHHQAIWTGTGTVSLRICLISISLFHSL